jgi:recombination protein RecT
MADERMNEMRKFLDARKGVLKTMIPNVGMSEEDFIRTVMHAIVKTPKLLDCTRESMWLALSQAAQLGLKPGTATGDCHLQPNKNKKTDRQGNASYETEATLIIGYRGYIALAKRSGQIGAIQAQIIYEHDVYDLEYTRMEKPLIHKPVIDRDPGRMIAAYCIWTEKDAPGEPKVEVMRRDQIDKIRQKALRGQTFGPWVDNYDEMARKTVIRRAQKRWMLSEDDLVTRAEEVVRATEGEVTDLPTSPDDPFVGDPPPPVANEDAKRKGARGAKARAAAALATPPVDLTPPADEPEVVMRSSTEDVDRAIFASPSDGDDN